MRRLHVVIGGYGRVGSGLADLLESAGHVVSVIDVDPRVFDGLESEAITGQFLIGSAFDLRVLEDAGMAGADCFVAVTSSDNGNMVAARIARQKYLVGCVIARIDDLGRAGICRGWGIATVSPATWTKAQLFGMVAHPDLHCEHRFEECGVEMTATRSRSSPSPLLHTQEKGGEYMETDRRNRKRIYLGRQRNSKEESSLGWRLA